MSRTIGLVLWPLFLRDALDWASRGYSCLLLAHSLICIISLALVPTLEKKFGQFSTIFGLSVIGAFSTLGFFFGPGISEDYLKISAHVVLALFFFGTTCALETSLRSIASLSVPPSLVASTFGLLALLGGLGSIFGHLSGTWMYTMSKNGDMGVTEFLSGGMRLPFLVVAGLLVVEMGLVVVAKWLGGRREK
jgi:MFS-type transporter involved in bile tolerance (Atg22 family)